MTRRGIGRREADRQPVAAAQQPAVVQPPGLHRGGAARQRVAVGQRVRQCQRQCPGRVDLPGIRQRAARDRQAVCLPAATRTDGGVAGERQRPVTVQTARSLIVAGQRQRPARGDSAVVGQRQRLRRQRPAHRHLAAVGQGRGLPLRRAVGAQRAAVAQAAGQRDVQPAVTLQLPGVVHLAATDKQATRLPHPVTGQAGGAKPRRARTQQLAVVPGGQGGSVQRQPVQAEQAAQVRYP
ncbi:hypothetical protein, partial [Dickeya sp. CSL RW240]|uniref:hypothetical protein n=1 Tax=Dickeya sp. CSL RW240 TaxID=1224144 RepID=UPI001F52051E